VLVALATLVIARCSATSAPQRAPGSAGHPLDLLSSQKGKLGWAGLFLGRSRARIEKLLARHLTVEESEAPACGQWGSRVEVAGREIHLQWSDQSSDAELQAIHVPFNVSEVESPAALARRAIAHVPGLYPPRGWDEASVDHLALGPLGGSSLLLKPAEPDRCFFVSYEACLD
jgi:hypothetical protein